MSRPKTGEGVSLSTTETVTPKKQNSTTALTQPSPVTALLNSLGISRESLVARADDVRKLLATDALPNPTQTEPSTPSRSRTVNNVSPVRRSAAEESLFTPPSASPVSKRSSNISDPSTPKTPSKTRKYDAMEAIIERKNRESASKSGRKAHHRTNTHVPPSPSAGRNRVTRSSTAAAAALNQTKTAPSASTSDTSPSNEASSSSLDALVTQPPLSKYYRAHTLVDKFSTPAVEIAPPPPVKTKKKPGPKPKQRLEKSASVESQRGVGTTRDRTPTIPFSVPSPVMALPEASSDSKVREPTPTPQSSLLQPQTDIAAASSQTPLTFPHPFSVFIPMPHGVANLTQEQISAYVLQWAAVMQNQQVQLPTQQLLPMLPQGSQSGATTPQYPKEDTNASSPLPPSSPPPSSPLSSPPSNVVPLPAETKKSGPPYTLPPGPYSPSKPSASYAAIIGRAILSSPEHRLTLQEIYDYITTVYPYFKRGETTWMNSIRHVLSTTKAFQKVIRERRQGKTQWAIFDEDLPCFDGGGYKKPGSGGSRKRKREIADETESPDSSSNTKKPKKAAVKSETFSPPSSQASQEPPAPVLVHAFPSPQRAAGHGPPIQPYYDQLLAFISPSNIDQMSNDDNDSDSDFLAQELEDALSSTDGLEDLRHPDDFDRLPTLDTEELLPPSSDFEAYTSSDYSEAASIFDLNALTQEATPRRRSSSTPPTSLPPSTTGFDLEEELKRTFSEDELPMLSPSDLLKPPDQWGKASPIRGRTTLTWETGLDQYEEEPLDLHSLTASQRRAEKGKQRALDSYPISPSVARRLGQRDPQTPLRRNKGLPESPLFSDLTSPSFSKLPADDVSPLMKRRQETVDQEPPSTPPRQQSVLPVSSLRTPLKNGSPGLATSLSGSRQLVFGADDSIRGHDTFESLFASPEVPTTPSTRRLSLSLATSASRPPVTPKRTIPPPVTPKRSSASKNNSLSTFSGGSGFSGTPSRYLHSYSNKNGSMSSPFRTPGSSSFSFSHLLDDGTGFGLTSPGFGGMFSPSKTKSIFDSPTGISAAFGKCASPSYGKSSFNILDDIEKLPSPTNDGW